MTTKIEKENEFLFRIAKENGMKVDARIYANQKLVDVLQKEELIKPEWNSLSQLKNVAKLPGIQKHAIGLTDIHTGYGAPVGCVGAFDLQEGVVAFGMVGFDINCGIQALKTNLTLKDVEKNKKQLADELYKIIPAGLGIKGELKLGMKEVDEVLEKGAEYCVKKGFGIKQDLEFIEENGKIKGANARAVSTEAKQRFMKQLGTLGSGNHYLEVQVVEKVLDAEKAEVMGLEKNQIVVFIHCGSRGLGHQIGADYLVKLEAAARKYKIEVPDKELVSAPIQSEEGQNYLGAVNAGINCAFANREVLSHLTREGFEKVFKGSGDEIETIYSVAHNTAKIEKHEIEGKMKKLLVQRKGATRSFAPGSEEIPTKYFKIGQPVLIGGTMGTSSYILTGTETAMRETFGSTIHGAGRMMSRSRALKEWTGEQLVKELGARGILLKGHGMKGLAEEAPGAYKDIDQVIEIIQKAGLSQSVVKLKPLIVIKG